MNWVDAVLIALVLLCGAVGMWTGLIRAAFAAQGGGGLIYEGPYYQVKIPAYLRARAARESVPVCIAAVNKGMIRAAAAAADGLIGHPVFTRKYIREKVLPVLEGTPCEMLPYVITSVAESTEQARNEVRGQIAFYYTTRLDPPSRARRSSNGRWPRCR